MILETPVLTLEHEWYTYGGRLWACKSELKRLFTSLPRWIVLHGSTQPDPEAVKVRLGAEGARNDYVIAANEEGAHSGTTLAKLDALRKQFLNAGYKTIYLSMIECE